MQSLFDRLHNASGGPSRGGSPRESVGRAGLKNGIACARRVRRVSSYDHRYKHSSKTGCTVQGCIGQEPCCAAWGGGRDRLLHVPQRQRKYSRAHGDSEYDIEGSKREADVAVSGISGLAGKRVTVYINGKRIGTTLVSRRGRAEREWSTARRQYVPLAGSGPRCACGRAAERSSSQVSSTASATESTEAPRPRNPAASDSAATRSNRRSGSSTREG